MARQRTEALVHERCTTSSAFGIVPGGEIDPQRTRHSSTPLAGWRPTSERGSSRSTAADFPLLSGSFRARHWISCNKPGGGLRKADGAVGASARRSRREAERARAVRAPGPGARTQSGRRKAATRRDRMPPRRPPSPAMPVRRSPPRYGMEWSHPAEPRALHHGKIGKNQKNRVPRSDPPRRSAPPRGPSSFPAVRPVRRSRPGLFFPWSQKGLWSDPNSGESLR